MTFPRIIFNLIWTVQFPSYGSHRQQVRCLHLYGNRFLGDLESLFNHTSYRKKHKNQWTLPFPSAAPNSLFSISLSLSFSFSIVYIWQLRKHGRGEEILCFRCFASHYNGWLLATYPWQGCSPSFLIWICFTFRPIVQDIFKKKYLVGLWCDQVFGRSPRGWRCSTSCFRFLFIYSLINLKLFE